MKYQQKLFVVAIIFYVITAYFSLGYYHADEHYQIIEFAGVLDGETTPKELPWEYSAKIRSAIQPVICYFVFQACRQVPITSPYSLAFILRILTGLLALIVIYIFTNVNRNYIVSQKWKLFLFLSYFLWFIPFINVRFSSETWSGLLFMLATSLVIKRNNSYRSYALLGCLLGLSFLFRYQMAISAIGLIAWLLFIQKESVNKIGVIVISGLCIAAIGVFIDSWFYGEYTLAPWNYFHSVIKPVVDIDFGTSPWYNYLFFIFRFSFFPIGIVILLALIISSIRNHKSIYVWVIFPFLIVHSIIPHKELRFLFPLVNFAPVLIIMAFEKVSYKNLKGVTGYTVKALIILVLSINFIALILASTKPAGIGRAKITKKINELNSGQDLNIFYKADGNPYTPWGLTANFYKETNAGYIEINSFEKKENVHIPLANSRNVMVVKISDLPDKKIDNVIKEFHLKEQCKSIPGFMIPLLKIYGYKTGNIMILYSD